MYMYLYARQAVIERHTWNSSNDIVRVKHTPKKITFNAEYVISRIPFLSHKHKYVMIFLAVPVPRWSIITLRAVPLVSSISAKGTGSSHSRSSSSITNMIRADSLPGSSSPPLRYRRCSRNSRAGHRMELVQVKLMDSIVSSLRYSRKTWRYFRFRNERKRDRFLI